MPKLRLTKTAVAKAGHTGEGNQTLYYDDGPGSIRALALRCTAGGAKAWVLNYRADRNRGGARRRLVIARFEDLPDPADARELAEDLIAGLVKDGTDPAEALMPDRGDKLEDVARRYLTDLKERVEEGKGAKRSGYQTMKDRLERHVVGASIGRKHIGSVNKEAVKRWHTAIGRTAPVEANRALQALSAVYGFARAEDGFEHLHNPTRNVTRFDETGKRRALTREELERLGKALAEAERTGQVTIKRKGKGEQVREVKRTVHASAVLAVRVLALTGCRRSEILAPPMKNRRTGKDGLRWRDVDFAAGVVRLRDTKTGAQKRILGKAALAVLAQARPDGARDDDPVCPSGHRDPATEERPAFVAIDKPRRALWEAAGIPLERGVDLHSLRHSFATVGATLEAGRYIGAVAALLGHKHRRASGITARYIDANQQEALRPAADAISGEIAGLLGLELPEVVPIHGEGR